MFAKRVSRHPTSGSASIARARLMHDPATRRNADRALPPSRPFSGPGLSAADQKRQVLLVLRSFDHFHLADLSYDAVRQITIALFRPDLDYHDVPHRIQIDARGNLLVTPIGPYDRPTRWRDWRRWLLSSVALTFAFVVLFALI